MTPRKNEVGQEKACVMGQFSGVGTRFIASDNLLRSFCYHPLNKLSDAINLVPTLVEESWSLRWWKGALLSNHGYAGGDYVCAGVEQFPRPLIITNTQDQQVLTVGIVASFQSQFGAQWNLMMAATFIAPGPLLLLFFTFKKHIVRSIQIGAGIK